MFIQQCATSSQFDYLAKHWNLLEKCWDKVETALSLPAITLMAHRLHDPRLLQVAYSRYGRVIRDTQHALTSVSLARLDSTLIAVLLLALFEALVFTAAPARTAQRWKMHILGAAELLQLRGPRQFNTALGRRLYVHASTGVRATCVMSATPAPKALLQTEQSALFQTEKPSASISDPWFLSAIRQGQLLQDIATYQSTRLLLPLAERIQACRDLDAQVEALLDMMHQVDTPRIEKAAPSASYRGLVKIYSSHHWSQRFNIFNMFRTFLCSAHNVGLMAMITELMEESPESLNSHSEPDNDLEALRRLYNVAEESAKSAAEDILYSVPFVLGMSGDPLFSARSITGPLFAVAASEAVPPQAREYATSRLEYLNHELAITQGVNAADMAARGIQANLQAW